MQDSEIYFSEYFLKSVGQRLDFGYVIGSLITNILPIQLGYYATVVVVNVITIFIFHYPIPNVLFEDIDGHTLGSLTCFFCRLPY
jgi:hypothetical protein